MINELGLNVENIIQIEGDDRILSNLYKNAESFIFLLYMKVLDYQ